MVVDTSVLVAIVLGEEDADRYARAMQADAEPKVSAVSVVEASMVVEGRQGPEAVRDLRLLLESAQATVEAVDPNQVELAVDAWRRFGKGRHPAALNLGDCFAYALAKALGETLLFKGEDFRQTDIASALD